MWSMNVISMQRSQRMLLLTIIFGALIISYITISRYIAKLLFITVYCLWRCYHHDKQFCPVWIYLSCDLSCHLSSFFETYFTDFLQLFIDSQLVPLLCQLSLLKSAVLTGSRHAVLMCTWFHAVIRCWWTPLILKLVMVCLVISTDYSLYRVDPKCEVTFLTAHIFRTSKSICVIFIN